MTDPETLRRDLAERLRAGDVAGAAKLAVELDMNLAQFSEIVSWVQKNRSTIPGGRVPPPAKLMPATSRVETLFGRKQRNRND
jgi:hypothetical protein